MLKLFSGAALALMLGGMAMAQNQGLTPPAPLEQSTSQAAAATPPNALARAKQVIQHIIVIDQENRSYDNYFGTYSGGNGFILTSCPGASISGTTLHDGGACTGGGLAIGMGLDDGHQGIPNVVCGGTFACSPTIASGSSPTWTLSQSAGTVATETITGVPCIPNPASVGGCQSPYHNPSSLNCGGSHTAPTFYTDFDAGLMDGFIKTGLTAGSCTTTDPLPDVMGYHVGYGAIFTGSATAAGVLTVVGPCTGSIAVGQTIDGYPTDFARGVTIASLGTGTGCAGTYNLSATGASIGSEQMSTGAGEIPNYWLYAEKFSLADHFFASVADYSYPSHMWTVSAWSAGSCTVPTGCVEQPTPPAPGCPTDTHGWYYLPYYMDNNTPQITWKYYLNNGGPECIWRPIQRFSQMLSQSTTYQTSHVVANGFSGTGSLSADIAAGSMPNVSWFIPTGPLSEHPNQGNLTSGMDYVTTIVNLIASSRGCALPCVDVSATTLIVIYWDDWGGMYDHQIPPISQNYNVTVPSGYPTQLGWGFRVPMILINPYINPGINTEYLSFDSITKFIEDVFLNGQRIGGGSIDSRPFVAENINIVTDPISGTPYTVGNILDAFNFGQVPITIPVLGHHF